MLQVQVDYWKLQETKRHDLEQEAIAREQNKIGWSNAAASNAQAAASNLSAYANLRNATSNERNAASNERNATSNEKNAEANLRNARSNEEQAAAATRNAEINAFNAATNRQNAESNRIQAESAWSNAVSRQREVSFQTNPGEMGWQKTYQEAKRAAAQAELADEQAAVASIEAGLKSTEYFYANDYWQNEIAKQEADIANRQAQTKTESAKQVAYYGRGAASFVQAGANIPNAISNWAGLLERSIYATNVPY